MSYGFYLGDITLPVAPGSVQIKYANKIRKIDLISGKEALAGVGSAVTEISFSALLPEVRYPFASYPGGFRKGSIILADILALKESGLPFRFIIVRNTPDGKPSFSTNIKTVFSELLVKEDAGDGSDIRVDVKLTEYREYAVKRIGNAAKSAGAAGAVSSSASALKNRTHKVVKGDCLWLIAQTYLGNGGRYKEIYSLNKEVIDARNKGTGNPVYTIYPGQILTIP